VIQASCRRPHLGRYRVYAAETHPAAWAVGHNDRSAAKHSTARRTPVQILPLLPNGAHWL